MAEQNTFPGDGHHSGIHPGVVPPERDMAAASGPFGVPSFHALSPRPQSNHAPVGASRAAIALLADFGRLCGLPSLRFGDDSCCWLGIGGGHIACIAAYGDSGFLRLHGEVAQLPPERDAPDVARRFSRLLADNASLAARGEGLPFAIDPRRNALVIVTAVPLTAPGQLLLDTAEDLIDQLAAIKRDPPSFDGGPQAQDDDGRNDDITEPHGATAGHAARRAGAASRSRQAPPPSVTGEMVLRV